jgi:rhodanese-related sulfurtransferase
MPECPEAAALSPATVTPIELAGGLRTGRVQVVQLSRSLDFREGHLPGALWGVRTRLSALRSRLRPGVQIVVAAPDDAVARLAVPELEGFGLGPVAVLEGGVAAWKEAGLPLQASRRNPEDADCIDVYLRPYDRNDGVEAAMREYLSWEIDLVHEVARDGDARFGEVAKG